MKCDKCDKEDSTVEECKFRDKQTGKIVVKNLCLDCYINLDLIHYDRI